jgi:hypothetical protein
MQERSAERYTISDMLRDHRSAGDMEVELRMADSIVHARMIDFSMQGLGVVIDDPDETLPGRLAAADSIFVKMIIGQNAIIAQAKRAWSTIVKNSGARALKAGFQFTVILPDDALALSKLALECRKGR